MRRAATRWLISNQFNAASSITQMIDGAGSHNYSYDTRDRLTAATHPSQTNESYTLDDVGNRTASHQGSSYSYQPFDRMVTANSNTFAYNGNGNLTSKTDATGSWTYTWDYGNRLKQASKSGGVTVTYAYDALGRRIQRTSSTGATTKFVYDGADVVRDLDGNGATVADYLNGPGIDNKLRQTAGGTSSYFVTDHLSTTRALTDASGNLTFTLSNDTFGNLTTGSASTRYTYTGREIDSDTGLMYYRARWYDPQVGRFISEDPIGLLGGLNLYSYVENNPLRFTDPLGLQKGCFNKSWTDCYAQCVENHRLDSLLPVLGSALPKRLLPPFRVVAPSQPLTTISSTIAHYLPNERIASALRGGGRLVSRIATPVLIFEGFYDLGILGSCAELCRRNPCN